MDLTVALMKIEKEQRQEVNKTSKRPCSQERLWALSNHQYVLRIMEGMKTEPERWKDTAVSLAKSFGYSVH